MGLVRPKTPPCLRAGKPRARASGDVCAAVVETLTEIDDKQALHAIDYAR